MSQSLQPQPAAAVSTWLLANREHLSLDKATAYLVGRLRTRTPLGAVEYLSAKALEVRGEKGIGQELFERRVELAATCVNLYEAVFPREYEASQSPEYSIQREHEFYRLINQKLFPLDCTMIDKDPRFFYPSIPIAGTQQHDWENGCCPFKDLQKVFQLVLVLSGRKGANGWRLIGLDKEPAPPLDAPAWSFFLYSLAVEPSPLRWLSLAFHLTCYTTHNPWLDAPRADEDGGREAAMFGGGYQVSWSGENVARLTLAACQASEINLKVMKLDQWLNEDPSRVARAVELWNKAAAATAREDGRRVYV